MERATTPERASSFVPVSSTGRASAAVRAAQPGHAPLAGTSGGRHPAWGGRSGSIRTRRVIRGGIGAHGAEQGYRRPVTIVLPVRSRSADQPARKSHPGRGAGQPQAQRLRHDDHGGSPAERRMRRTPFTRRMPAANSGLRRPASAASYATRRTTASRSLMVAGAKFRCSR